MCVCVCVCTIELSADTIIMTVKLIPYANQQTIENNVNLANEKKISQQQNSNSATFHTHIHIHSRTEIDTQGAQQLKTKYEKNVSESKEVFLNSLVGVDLILSG